MRLNELLEASSELKSAFRVTEFKTLSDTETGSVPY